MFTSVPGSARIWSNVSTWFLLQALWRRVSPSTRTHNRQMRSNETKRRKREIPKLGCVWCPFHCPLLFDFHSRKHHQNVPKHIIKKKKKKSWPKKNSSTHQWGRDLWSDEKRGEIFKGASKKRLKNYRRRIVLVFSSFFSQSCSAAQSKVEQMVTERLGGSSGPPCSYLHYLRGSYGRQPTHKKPLKEFFTDLGFKSSAGHSASPSNL